MCIISDLVIINKGDKSNNIYFDNGGIVYATY